MKFPYDKRHLNFGNAGAIQDPDAVALLDNICNLNAFLNDENIHLKFLKKYREWIMSSKNNEITGLEHFSHAAFSNGTTEGFDKFYMRNRNKRFRCFKGEYMYHRLVWRNHWSDWKYIEDDDLDVNDAVVVSLPFADTGNRHIDLDDLLTRCDALKIPVLLDCAYFGTCYGQDIDLNHECISDVTFSLSKSFPVAHLRIGMRLTRVNDDDPLFVVNHSAYINRLAAGVGLEFISTFTPDYIYNKYRDQQVKISEYLNVTPSSTVMFGIGGNQWGSYNRGTETNRLSFHRWLHMDIESFKKENAKG